MGLEPTITGLQTAALTNLATDSIAPGMDRTSVCNFGDCSPTTERQTQKFSRTQFFHILLTDLDFHLLSYNKIIHFYA